MITPCNRYGFLVTATAAVSIFCASTTLSWATGEDKEALCATAEERYEEIYGKPSADENATIVKMYKFTILL